MNDKNITVLESKSSQVKWIQRFGEKKKKKKLQGCNQVLNFYLGEGISNKMFIVKYAHHTPNMPKQLW